MHVMMDGSPGQAISCDECEEDRQRLGRDALRLLREGMRYLGDNPDRSRNLDHRQWREKAEAFLNAHPRDRIGNA